MSWGRAPEPRNQIASITDLIKGKKQLYDIVDLDLTLARNEKKLAIVGDFFYLLDAPSSISASIRFNDFDAASISIKKGFRFQLPFHQIFFTNSAQAGVTIKIVVGRDLAFDFSELGVINVDEILQPIVLKGPNSWDVAGSPVTINDIAGGTLIKSATLSRGGCTLFNEGLVACRVGKLGVTFAGGAGAAGGILLNPGASMIVSYTGAIYAITDTGTSTTIGFTDEYTV